MFMTSKKSGLLNLALKSHGVLPLVVSGPVVNGAPVAESTYTRCRSMISLCVIEGMTDDEKVWYRRVPAGGFDESLVAANWEMKFKKSGNASVRLRNWQKFTRICHSDKNKIIFKKKAL
jgi:hypothetical protein